MKGAALLWVGLAAIAVSGTVTASGADYTANSPSPGNGFAAAADFNTVAVSLSDPGTPLSGTVALTATASSERGIDRVRFQASPADAGAWSDVCSDGAAPYGCDWDTAAVADGSRDLRAVAVDHAGHQRPAAIAARVVDNTPPSASLSDPGVLQGSETLTATAADATSGLATLEIAHRPVEGTWTTPCSGSTSPRSCALDTTTLADGGHELRARATDAAGNVRDVTLTRTADNTAPGVPTISNPGTPLSGSVAFTGTAADGGSGIAACIVQYRTAGSGTWTDACSDTAAADGCSWDTTGVADGLYDVRSLARTRPATRPALRRSPAGASTTWRRARP